MLLNEIEERCYVGRTKGPMTARINQHWQDALHGTSKAPLHEAMRRWDDRSLWTEVVLQSCYSDDELNAAEAAWIELCSSREGGVGYNVKDESRSLGRTTKRVVSLTTKKLEKGAWSMMSADARREYLRDCGRKGAALSAGT